MKHVISSLLVLAALLLLPACATLQSGGNFLQENQGAVAGLAGVAWTAQKLQYLKPEFLAGGLIAYGIYDPFSPTWEIKVTELDDERRRIDLNMKRLATGGDGEARQVFLRVAQALAEKGGHAGFDELRYTEGIESTRPFARRIAAGDIRLVTSRQFPAW
ncbi:MAG: hypothetical protein LBF91_07155 [Azoarcus sp.]|jgi:hypothetical protein|nr:hypothetical protein [Azoarcus sp.]